ncbi:uncharacterized membrane protein YhaH (DUF805 family) [Rhodobium orientis]|uniref:DUF805 domain-containing protein n=1 Tax=Rhodobium orientis TaxID=34017 RepID=A0A327JXB2_9HYPH|nr:DUF805 domain-containing protein [Rhodobium orientis]MBB4304674.1 uncharacterized membrane protein YhaH (DUF805 family) [Rhodobium orientis]MBK5950049.1 hypothetical protein [Rhodobium orientis]RAI27738.1 hypothetical protein CH339_09335 [Rhodobium orientis]
MSTGPGSGLPKMRGVLWLFFGIDGRISREPYWLGILLLNMVMLILLGTAMRYPETQATVGVILPFAVIPMIWAEIALMAKRAHDYGLTGFVALLAFVPFVNILTAIFLGVVPGEKGPNAYGKRANLPD